MSAASPLAGLERMRSGPDGTVVAFTAPGRDDRVIAGHYPGFPVLPGVYLIEAVDRSVRQWADDAPVELSAMDRCRFHSPVFPGDRITADITVRQDAEGLLCDASVSTDRGRSADIRLRYRKGEQ
ncbi:hypothetical protein U9R90_16615 [Streptomyces sp. E11-3]|uniref:hypothetical protein n=1 Tax=Streptomyces sp. E11-3 TaxID=3110112 RepID=UPI00398005C3